ncbi:MAG: hypothetical protein GY795_01830 [Desulfobacterales bacterium]|nr:hypothetical protein [Desulfobacterales bacterium]
MKNRVRIICFTLVAALISGCGLTSHQIVKTQSFGAATADIGKLGQEEFVNIRNGIIEMNKELFSIDNTKTSKSLVFDKPAFAEPTSKRIAACKALKLYGELLVQLVKEDRSENLQNTAKALIDNTTVALNRELSEGKKEALNKIIVGLGSFWIDKKKADAAKEIIPAYQQPVDDLADLLSEDFSLEGSYGFLKAYEITAKRLKNASMKLVNAGDKYTILERDRAVRAFAMAENAITRSTELSKKAKKAIDSLKKANAELVEVISEQNYSTDDIKDYGRQIQELVNMHQVLNN